MEDDKAPKDEAKSTIDQQWEDDFDKEELTIPYKREETAPVKEEKQEQSQNEDEEEDTDLPDAPDLENIVTLEDPGEYKPNDYSFEYDIDGKKYKISSSEDIDKIDEEDLEKLRAKDLTTLLRKANAIDAKLERDEDAYNEKKKAYDKQVDDQDSRDEVIATFAAEFDYLVSKNLLPEVPEKYQNADWSDPEVAKKDGVKEQKEVLDYMVKENEQRAKLKLKPITSIVDAFNALQQEKGRSKDEEDNKAKGNARKAAGSRVSGTSNNPVATPSPRGIAVGRVDAFRTSTMWE